MGAIFFCGLIFVISLIILVLSNIKQINQYEKGLLFSFGRFSSILEPGWHFIIPIVQGVTKIDVRTKTVDLADQEAITRDNVSTRISAVLYFKVADAQKAILEVEYFAWATSQLAETTMRTVVGEFTLDELLGHRNKVASKIEEIVEHTASTWGIEILSVELKDVILPETMKRTMAKQAEAEREKRATIINSEGEVIAAENLKQAAALMSDTPGALHLRTLNSINDISSDDSNTVIFMVPMEALRAVDGIAKAMGGLGSIMPTATTTTNKSKN